VNNAMQLLVKKKLKFADHLGEYQRLKDFCFTEVITKRLKATQIHF
jgi:hypothetical protein